jgi:signal transduction histidine kinase
MTAGTDRFAIVVTDNGQGFDVAAAEQAVAPGAVNRTKRGGNGLLNMRQRLADIGRHCTLVSQSGEGTTVRLSVPLHAETLLKR